MAERIFTKTGKAFFNFFIETGKVFFFFIEALFNFFKPPFRFSLFAKQINFIGAQSLSLVILSSFFSGMVSGYQSNIALSKVGAESILGGAVALALTRELAPVLTAIVVTARAGSSIAAELGSMRITEQIDALEILAVNPVQYLVSPRLWAGIVVMPLLVGIADIVGIIGGGLIGVFIAHVDLSLFIKKMQDMVDLKDIFSGLIKSVFFGAFLITVCAYKGFYSGRKAEDIGKATTQAVVISTVGILVIDYIITALLF